MNNPCIIIEADAMTAIGTDRESIWQAMMRNQCGLKPATRFENGKYLTDIAGEFSHEAIEKIRNCDDYNGKPLVELFAAATGRQTLSRALKQGVAVDLNKTGLVLATTKADIQPLYKTVSHCVNDSCKLSNPGTLARAIAKSLNIHGPSVAVSNACAAGLVAIIQGIRMLNRGTVDHVLVIGAEAVSDFTLAGFSCVNAISSKPCRPFDAERDGLSLGEGAGAVLLARDYGDNKELARIEGYSVTNDAGHLVSPSPTGRGLAQAINHSLKMAGWEANQVEIINAHGTATLQNDNMESHALHAVFNDAPSPTFSVKGYFGHTLGAAGVIETVVSLMAMQNNTVPATLGYQKSGVDHPINASDKHREIDSIQRALTLKSGFGGVNAAVAFSMSGGAL